jgi:hypothetical protein
MTEWCGIKVGNLYKRTGRGSSRAPLALVVEMEDWYHCPGRHGDGIELTTLEDGKLQYSWLTRSLKGDITVDGDAWPYKLAAAPA